MGSSRSWEGNRKKSVDAIEIWMLLGSEVPGVPQGSSRTGGCSPYLGRTAAAEIEDGQPHKMRLVLRRI